MKNETTQQFNTGQLCECGHFEAAHSDGLPDDRERLCSMCRECQGYITPAERRETAPGSPYGAS